MKYSFVLMVLVFASSLAAADGELQVASIGDFRLESGEVLRDGRIGYRTFVS